MIDYIEVDGGRLLVGAGAQSLPNYFDIDSMSLLLGRNGAGKTRMLLKAAEALTQRAGLEDQARWHERGNGGEGAWIDSSKAKGDIGVAYFTPVPFRRAIARSRGYVDASTISGARYKQQLASSFPGVAASLGVRTRLVGRISYRAGILQARIGALLLSKSCLIHDDQLESRKNKLLSLDELDRMQSAQESRKFSLDVMNWIRAQLSKAQGRIQMVASLATLEFMSGNLKGRGTVTESILEHLGLVSFDWRNDAAEVVHGQVIDHFKLLRGEALDSAHAGVSQVRYRAFGQHSRQLEFDVDPNHSSYRQCNRSKIIELAWLDLSSGLISLVQQFTRLESGLSRLRSRGFKSVIVMIDEGDAYLHLEWQREYVDRINAFMKDQKSSKNFDCLQVILATHSPIISGDFPSSMVQRLDDSDMTGIKTFGSALDSLVLDTFRTPSIGSYAAKKIRHLRSSAEEGMITGEDKQLLSEIGDAALYRAIIRGTQQAMGAD